MYTPSINNGLTGTCQYCGANHTGICPRIKKVKYHQNGTIKEVELHSRFNWPLIQLDINVSDGEN